MFKNLFRKKNRLTSFTELHASPIREQYFTRAAEWDWLEPEVMAVYDPKGPRVFTLDAWAQWIFLDANGEQTIRDYVYNWAEKYSTTLPKQLDVTILETVMQLAETYGIIQLSEEPQPLEKRFAHPKGSKAKHDLSTIRVIRVD